MALNKYPIHNDVKSVDQIRRELQKIGFYFGDLDDRVSFCSNFTAILDPTANDDVTEGYFPGCLWFNTVLDTFWIMEDNTAGAAVWTQIGGPGGFIDGDLVESHIPMLSLDLNNEVRFRE
ncbi:MAG: hypothetical protein ACYTFZ_07930 [Planctomycetota bacterium]|jgi:hypothetical protein